MDKNKSTPIEAIDFQSLNEPSSASKQASTNKNYFVWITFLVLVACGIGVFLFLPKYVPEKALTAPTPIEIIQQQPDPKPNPNELPQPVVEEAPSLSAQELNEFKVKAETLLLQVIKKQEALDAKAVKKWAEEEYEQALAHGIAGDENFRINNFTEAINSYQQAIAALERLEEKVAPTLTNHLEQGESALLQANRETALFHFELAKDIEEENTQALNGIQRAQTIEELFQLLEKGGNLEAANRLDDAKQIYQHAIDLDPLSSEAKMAFDRVASRLIDIEFSRLIAEGYKALELRQYNNARSAFQSAQKLMPGLDKAQIGLAKVAGAIRNDKISALTVEAQHFESLEEWGHAVQSYQQILSLNAKSTLANDGVKRCQERASLLLKLDDHLNNQERLYSEGVAQEAESLLTEVALLNAPGEKITQRANALKELLLINSQPISITLQSDNLTEVAIFKVGKFGRFENQKIELKPGKYTIVGSRPGYRDVRKVLTITAETSKTNILVRCEEPI